MQQPDTQKVRWTRSALGIDLSDDGSPVVIRAERLGPTLRFQTLTPDAARIECAGAGTRVAAAMPVRDTVVRRVSTPLSTRAKAMRVLPAVLDVQIPFPIEECEYRFHDLRRTPEGTFDALVVAARHADMSRRIASLAEAGLDPVTLDSEALALWSRSLRELPPSGAGEPRVLVSLHKTHSVVIIGHGRRILGAHHVRGTDPASVLRILGPYRNGEMQQPVQWCWAGPAAADAGRLSAMAGALQAAWPGRSATHETPAAFLARSVAAREVAPDDIPCNLREGPLTHPARLSRERRRSSVAASFALLCGLTMVAAASAAWWIGSKREAAIAETVSRMTDRLAGYHVTAKGEHALRLVRASVDARVESLQPFRRQIVDSPAAVVPDVLDSATRHGLQIETLTVTPRKLAISGTARGWQSCDDIVMRLERRGMKTKLDRREAREDLRIPFALAAEAPDG